GKDATGARTHPRPGLCRGAPSHAYLFCVADHAIGRASERAFSQDQERQREAADKTTSLSGLKTEFIRPRPRVTAAEGRAAPMCPRELQPARRPAHRRDREMA